MRLSIHGSRQDFAHDPRRLALEQSVGAAVVRVHEAVGIQAEQVQKGRVLVVVGYHVLDRVMAEVIRSTVDAAAFDPAAGEPGAEAVRVVVAPRIVPVDLGDRESAHLAAPVHHGRVEPSAPLEVGDQRRGRPVCLLAPTGPVREDTPVRVPGLRLGEDLHEADAVLDQPTGTSGNAKCRLHRPRLTRPGAEYWRLVIAPTYSLTADRLYGIEPGYSGDQHIGGITMPRDQKTGITRRTFVAGSAAAAVGVAAGIEAGAAPPPGVFPGAPPFAVDDTTECELLICVRDIPTSRWRDGDVAQAFSTHDALRVHADTIVHGRGEYRGDALPELQALYAELTQEPPGPPPAEGRQPLPTEQGLSSWWTRAEQVAGLNRQDFVRFPFSPLEEQKLLVLPLAVDVTPALRQMWQDAEGHKKWKMRVDWRTAVVAPGLARAADVTDRAIHVTFDQSFPVSVVSYQPELLPKLPEV